MPHSFPSARTTLLATASLLLLTTTIHCMEKNPKKTPYLNLLHKLIENYKDQNEKLPELPIFYYWHDLPNPEKLAFMKRLDPTTLSNLAQTSKENYQLFKELTKWQQTKTFAAFVGHAREITSLILSPDESLIASVCQNQHVHIWSIDALTAMPENTFIGIKAGTKPLATLKRENAKAMLCSMRFDPPSTRLFTAWSDGYILACDNKENTSTIFKQHTDNEKHFSTGLTQHVSMPCTDKASASLSLVQLSNSCTKVVSKGNTGKIEIWSPLTGKIFATLIFDPQNLIKSLVFNYKDKLVLGASSDGLIRLWSARTAELLQTIKASNAPIYALFSPHGAYIVTTSQNADKKIDIWSTQTGEHITAFNTLFPITRALCSEDNDTIITQRAHHDTADMYSIHSGVVLGSLHGIKNIESLALSKTSKLIFSAFGTTIQLHIPKLDYSALVENKPPLDAQRPAAESLITSLLAENPKSTTDSCVIS